MSRSRYSRFSSYSPFPEYVPVWKKKAIAAEAVKKLSKKGEKLDPVTIEGRKITQTWWGTSWCDNLERYRDFAYRLERGRTYVRNGSVIDLHLEPGTIRAKVSGSSLYSVKIDIKALEAKRWKSLVDKCSGQIDSVVELLQGDFSDAVMKILTTEGEGLFPHPREIKFDCSCPDVASMCKHVAAVMYGIGNRLDRQPDLLFRLRQVDGADLVSQAVTEGLLGTAGLAGEDTLAASESDLGGIFGIELDLPAPKRTFRKGEIPATKRVLDPPEVTGTKRRGKPPAADLPPIAPQGSARKPAAAGKNSRRDGNTPAGKAPSAPISAAALIAAGIARDEITALHRQGFLVRLEKGVYQITPEVEALIERRSRCAS